nr:hypothetical protein [Tanacetum cinerariifolium]
MSWYNHPGCSCCGGSFNDENCPRCSSVGSRNEFVYDPNTYSYNETPNFYNQPSQHQYETNSCEFCGNDAHYGYDCPPQVQLVYNKDPCFNQNTDNFPQTSPNFQQQYLCCGNCRGPHETFQVSEIKDAFGNKQYKPEDIQELFRKLFSDVQNIHEELAEYINTPSWNRPAFYNNDEDDDEEYTIAITPSEPDPGDLTSIIDLKIHENVSFMKNVNLPFEDDQFPLFAYVVWIFLSFLTYPVSPSYLLSFGNEDTIFDPGISIYYSFMPGISHQSGTFMKFNDYPNHFNECPMEILSSTCFPMDQ